MRTGSESTPAETGARTDLYHGLFCRRIGPDGQPSLSRHAQGPHTIPCPTTGRSLRVATIDAASVAICPTCDSQGHGGFVTFDGDLRMAYACPTCCVLVWLAGA